MMKIFRRVLPLAVIVFTVLAPLSIQAQMFWEKVISPSGLFSTAMRVDHEIRSDSLIVGKQRAVYSEDISALVDHRPYKSIFKNFSVTVDQTFGPFIPPNEQAWLARREIEDLIESYESYNYFIQERDTDYTGRYKGERIKLVYEDPDFGVQAVMLNVRVGAISKYKQLAIVPADFMEDRKVFEYFKSLRFDDGIAQTDREILEEWQTITSLHRIFSVMVPPYTKPFFTKDPVVKKTENAEVVRYIFRDPVRRQNLYYNLYGYKTDGPLTFEKVEKIIGKNHITPHRRDPSKIGLSKRIEKETPFLVAEYNITPTKKIPYLKKVRLRVFFKDSFVFVQEVMGSQDLVDGSFTDRLLGLYKFHPEHAKPLSKTVAAPPKEENGVENVIDAIIEEGDEDGIEKQEGMPEEIKVKAAPDGQKALDNLNE